MSLLDRLFGGGRDGAVRPERARELQHEGAVLLDVREQQEWVAGRAPGALHIPLGQLAGSLGQVPAGAHVLTVCRSGGRSARAARILAAHGYRVSDVRGGMRAWAARGLPVVAAQGRPGRVV